MKPDNVLVSIGIRDGKKRLCVSDFGLSFSMPENQVLVVGAARGTKIYMPPEVLNPDVPPYRHPRSDVFSAALIVLFWILGRDPVARPDGSYELKEAQRVLSPAAFDVLRLMLSIDPMQRPSPSHLGLFDPLRSENVEPAGLFCDVVREALHDGPTIAGLPFVNHMLSANPTLRTRDSCSLLSLERAVSSFSLSLSL